MTQTKFHQPVPGTASHDVTSCYCHRLITPLAGVNAMWIDSDGLASCSEAPIRVNAADVTGDLLRRTDLDLLRIVTPSGRVYGEDMPSLAFGLGSWDGDYDGFAEYLRSR